MSNHLVHEPDNGRFRPDSSQGSRPGSSIGRFSEGQEVLADSARKSRIGRFSDGQEAVVAQAPSAVGRFSEGQERWVGRFSDGQERVAG